MRLADVHAAITTVPEVASMHDLHLWAITQSQPSLTAHAVLEEGADGEAVRRAIANRLRDEFDLHHTTLQMERISCAPSEHVH
jgi:cobalt-zinc-cadmium efflux system protein